MALPPAAVPFAAMVPRARLAAAAATPLQGILYVAVFLTPASREVLLSLVPACHPIVRADHMTLAHRPALAQLLALPLGAVVALRVIGQSADSRAQALAVDPPAWLPPTTCEATHVTMSLAPGVAAKEAGALLSDAMQRAAAGDMQWAGPEGGVAPGGTA